MWYALPMKRLLAVAVLLAGLVFPLYLDAQFRSAPRSMVSSPVRIAPSFSGIRPTPAPVRTVVPAPVRTVVAPGPAARVPVRTGFGRPGPFAGTGAEFGHPRYAPRRFNSCSNNPVCGQLFHHRRHLFASPGFLYPYGWYPPVNEQPVEEAPAVVPEQDGALSSQVQTLTEEVEMMREEQASRQEQPRQAASPQAAVQEKPVTTVLVYRDGRQSDVENYAIFGQNLWVFAEQATRKIALADLDLAATKRLNDARGVEFVSPD